MQLWEYRTALLNAVAVTLIKTSGWRLKEVNEQEQSNWKKTEIYPRLVDFCNQMGREGWELTSASYPDHTVEKVILYFKRPLQ
jgi:hypothetical protein